MRSLIKTSHPQTVPLLLFMLALILMSLTGCVSPMVISADQLETPLKAGQSFTPAADGWYMTQTRYQRYRRAVADAILREETTTNSAK